MNNKNKEEIKKDFSVFAKHFLLKQPNEVQAKEDSIIIEEMKTLNYFDKSSNGVWQSKLTYLTIFA
jgi:hypothetical protein